jgi:phosphoglycerol transferase MdoB-like AlkP superfamily enzyme
MVKESKKGNMELKTNEEGKTVIDVLPTGDTLRLQVIAKGFQTFGQDFPIDKSDMSIEVRLRRPGEQYSIYKEKKPEQSHGKDTTADKATDKDAQKNTTTPPEQPK